MRLRRLVLGCFLIGCRASTTPAPAASSGGFIVRLGNDTVSAESYTRAGDRLEGIVVRRVPRTVITRYAATVGSNGLPSRIVYSTRLPDGSKLPNGADSIVAEFTGDSVITRIARDTIETRRVAAVNAYPVLTEVLALHALPIAVMAGIQRDSVAFRSYPPGAATSSAGPIVRKGPNRYWLYSEGNPIEIVTDDRGGIQSIDGKYTTYRIQTTRQPAADVPGLAASFARREREAGPIVALSTRDTVRATVGRAGIQVNYGRPAARGRTVFGPNGVLGDTLWRTGANQSTQFRTDAALSIGGTTLPPGQYMLMTLAVPGRYHLIFYEASRELTRVPLQVASMPALVERFTILVEPTGADAGVIRLRWDRTELSAPFKVADP